MYCEVYNLVILENIHIKNIYINRKILFIYINILFSGLGPPGKTRINIFRGKIKQNVKR